MPIVYTYMYIMFFSVKYIKLLLDRKHRFGFVRPLRTHDNMKVVRRHLVIIMLTRRHASVHKSIEIQL